MNALSMFFIILLGLAVYHFVYEGIFLPSLRLDLRFRLFALRDNLRLLKCEHKVELSGELFSYIEATINNSINLLPIINIQLFNTVHKAIAADPELRRRIEKRSAIIDGCKIEAVQKVRRKALKIVGLAFVANSAGWIIYLLPLVFGAICYHQLKEFCKNIIFYPEREVSHIIPPADLAFA